MEIILLNYVQQDVLIIHGLMTILVLGYVWLYVLDSIMVME